MEIHSGLTLKEAAFLHVACTRAAVTLALPLRETQKRPRAGAGPGTWPSPAASCRGSTSLCTPSSPHEQCSPSPDHPDPVHRAPHATPQRSHPARAPTAGESV